VFRVPYFGFLVSGSGFRVPGCRILGGECRVSGSEFRVPCSVFRVSGPGFQVSGLWLRASCFEIRVLLFVFRDPGSGSRDSGFGIRDSGFGIRDSVTGYRLSPSCRQAVGKGTGTQHHPTVLPTVAPYALSGSDRYTRTRKMNHGYSVAPYGTAYRSALRTTRIRGTTRIRVPVIPVVAPGSRRRLPFWVVLWGGEVDVFEAHRLLYHSA